MDPQQQEQAGQKMPKHENRPALYEVGKDGHYGMWSFEAPDAARCLSNNIIRCLPASMKPSQTYARLFVLTLHFRRLRAPATRQTIPYTLDPG